jgi:hypothetical protein
MRDLPSMSKENGRFGKFAIRAQRKREYPQSFQDLLLGLPRAEEQAIG